MITKKTDINICLFLFYNSNELLSFYYQLKIFI